MSKCCREKNESFCCLNVSSVNDESTQGTQRDSRCLTELEKQLNFYHEGAPKIFLDTVAPEKTFKPHGDHQRRCDQKQHDNVIICFCFSITRDTIVDALQSGKTTFEQLQEELLVGTGCQRCVPDVQKIIDEAIRQQE